MRVREWKHERERERGVRYREQKTARVQDRVGDQERQSMKVREKQLEGNGVTETKRMREWSGVFELEHARMRELESESRPCEIEIRRERKKQRESRTAKDQDSAEESDRQLVREQERPLECERKC